MDHDARWASAVRRARRRGAGAPIRINRVRVRARHVPLDVGRGGRDRIARRRLRRVRPGRPRPQRAGSVAPAAEPAGRRPRGRPRGAGLRAVRARRPQLGRTARRVVAGRQPELVAGLVLVDATDEGCELFFTRASDRQSAMGARVLPWLARVEAPRGAARRLATARPTPMARSVGAPSSTPETS